MIEHTYSEPVSKLLLLGRPHVRDWLNYLELGFTREDIPELIRLVKDKDLRWMAKPDDLSEDEELPEWYGQIHAWRTLAQLKAQEAIPALIDNLQEIDKFDDEWYGEDAFEVFPMIGVAAIRPLAEYLANTENGVFARTAASASLQKMSEAHPETWDECAAALAATLENYKENDETVNALLISDLMEMDAAIDHIALIENAYKDDCVDTFVEGDFEDLQVELGLIEERAIPRPHMSLFEKPPSEYEELIMFERSPQEEKDKKKEKNKRKQEKKSRKKNRKKK